MDEPTKQPHGIGWYSARGVLALVLYVASVGPFTYLAARSDSKPDWLWDIAEMAYAPLVAICISSPILERSMMEYQDWWTALAEP